MINKAVRYGLFCVEIGIAVTVTGCTGIKLILPVEPGKSEPEMKQSNYTGVISVDGKCWFDRGGEHFLALGVNCVLPRDSSEVRDGVSYDVLPRFDRRIEAWAAAAVNRLTNWHFNTVGGWSHNYLYDQIPMYHTRVLQLGPWGENDSRLLDVFSASYREAVDQEAQKSVAPHVTNEYLIGYFANNELPWYGERGWPTTPKISLLTRYMQLPREAAGKLRLIDFFKAYYQNDFSAFSRDWDVHAESFDALRDQRRIAARSRICAKVTAEWAGIVAEQYFSLCAGVIRRYDPNHLFLGARFAGRAQKSVMAACGKYTDVVSINLYSKTGEVDVNFLNAVAALTGRPILITEFSWRAMENSSGCSNALGADVTVLTQQDRADAFRRYATQILALPYLVGYDWFQLFDQPPAGRFDGENSNYGLLDVYDHPYEELLAAITEINGQANDLHAHSACITPPYNADDLSDYREISIRGTNQPLTRPLLFADGTARYSVWMDQDAGAMLDVRSNEDGTATLNIVPKGWGCGITFYPQEAFPKNPDGSVSLLGGRQVLVDLVSDREIRAGIGLNESGCGAVNSQTFTGYAGADGESYSGTGIELPIGKNPYIFPLSNLEPGPSYGNQRGNRIMDMQAVVSLQLYFPPDQSPCSVMFRSLSVQ